ncbi:ECF-type sigma factor [Acanthopleuribacter pedis]|uniref:Sigma-70 family RNA polymerase sigma factor n=1 Tax=Acanthopleuribacter pedis TaxID=442870 RepID=A0A8J7QBY7_9BACT|nr:ECF-type sigma factor [Acanthopleuribacter pedis]MBO1320899.1 sigma-70 family RNA polymerase sigma factor [Acanthopleuribacter pedis]
MSAKTVTRRLHAWHGGDATAFEVLIEEQYTQLKKLGRSLLAKDRLGNHLQATELISLAFISLSKKQAISWTDRQHFFRVAARTMRRLLIQEARRLNAEKRGADQQHQSLNEAFTVASNYSAEALTLLDAALSSLHQGDAEAGQVVELRFFGGFSVAECAEILAVSEPTIKRKWRFAKAYLASALAEARP